MGRYLAAAAKKAGRVTWVKCPEDAETAGALLKKLSVALPKNDVLVMAAAVCDVKPRAVSSGKLKKDGLFRLDLVPNPDILAALAKKKKKGQIFAGFALESENILENGFQKLRRKKMEVILIQKVTSKKSPFGETRLEAYLMDKNGRYKALKNVHKKKAAELVVQTAKDLFLAPASGN